MDIIPRIKSEVRTADGKNTIPSHSTTLQHGEEVLEVVKGMKKSDDQPNNKIYTILGSFGLDFYDTDKTENVYGAILSNKETYDAALAKFGTQSVKIFNQSFGSTKAYDDSEYRAYRNEGDNLPLYFNRKEGSAATVRQEKQVPYFRDIVENKGGLFIWAAGNKENQNSSVNAGLPYFENKLEPGWISVVGVKEQDGLMHNVMGSGSEELSAAGYEASYWAISALMYSAENSQQPDPNKKIGIGSSYAAPRVTAAAALVYEKYPWMTNDQIRQTLFTTTDTTNTIFTPTRRVRSTPDSTYGWGMLNTKRALKGPGAFMDVSYYGDTSTFKANIPAGTAAYFDNDIYGDGGLQKLGMGTLHLTGNNSFSGGSTVTNGILGAK